MDAARVRKEVEAFRVRTAFGMAPEDLFPAWYLHRRFSVPESSAVDQSSDPALDGRDKGYDFGLDAFHLDQQDGKTRLCLIQAKYSTPIAAVKQGFRDLRKLPAVLHRILEGVESDENRENKVIVNLRRELNRLSAEQRRSLPLDFLVLHLCSDDHEIVLNECSHARSELRETVEVELPDRVSTIGHVGPPRMAFQFPGDETVAPPSWLPLRLEAARTKANYKGGDVHMFYGIGRLSDLVEMYSQRRDNLFSKNVRYYLKTAKNTERGPAAKIRDTLHEACIKQTVEPELFAFLHNGITVFARSVRQVDGRVEVQEPFVLNGCQTIKSAYLFSRDPKVKDRLLKERWDRVSIPLRITTTRDESLVQLITLSNNRQNSISSAALRANDEVQLELEERFRRRHFFYERQEGAFAQITDTNPEVLEEEYENSNDLAVNLVDLARAIAAAQGGAGLDYALRPNDIFEHDGIYKKVFNKDTLTSIVFLTFLQNLHDVVFLILKRDLKLEKQSQGPSPSKLGYHTIALLVRHLAREKKHEFVLRFGTQRLGKRAADFRDELRRELSNFRSHIQTALKDSLLAAPDAKAETLRAAYAEAERSLKLHKEIDPFAVFAKLDDQAEEDEEEDIAVG